MCLGAGDRGDPGEGRRAAAVQHREQHGRASERASAGGGLAGGAGDMDGERFSKDEAMGGVCWGPWELWSALYMGGQTSNLLGQRGETG